MSRYTRWRLRFARAADVAAFVWSLSAGPSGRRRSHEIPAAAYLQAGQWLVCWTSTRRRSVTPRLEALAGELFDAAWVWLKINQEGLRRFWSMVPLARVPFWYRFFEPQPHGSNSCDPPELRRELHPRRNLLAAEPGATSCSGWGRGAP